MCKSQDLLVIPNQKLLQFPVPQIFFTVRTVLTQKWNFFELFMNFYGFKWKLADENVEYEIDSQCDGSLLEGCFIGLGESHAVEQFFVQPECQSTQFVRESLNRLCFQIDMLKCSPFYIQVMNSVMFCLISFLINMLMLMLICLYICRPKKASMSFAMTFIIKISEMLVIF